MVSRHERLNFESIRAFQRVAHWIDESVPVILETPVEEGDVDEEISAAERVFAFVHSFTDSHREFVEEKRQRIQAMIGETLTE